MIKNQCRFKVYYFRLYAKKETVLFNNTMIPQKGIVKYLREYMNCKDEEVGTTNHGFKDEMAHW